MAVSYLDKTGLSYFWGKVKALAGGKVDKENGKGLSTEDYTTTEKGKLGDLPTNSELTSALGNKADKDPDAVEGHLAKFDANGNPVDGGDTADYAKNLVAPVVQSDAEFVYRKTGGNLAVDGKGGAAEIQKIKGKTLVWNQLTPLIDAHYDGIISGDERGYVYTATVAGYNMAYNGSWHKLIPGHKYYYTIEVKNAQDQIIGITFNSDEPVWWLPTFYASSDYVRKSGINTAQYTSDHFEVHFYSIVAEQVVYFRNILFVDLTLLFNGNVPENFTAEDFERMFPLPYYEQNDGQLINNDAEGIETVGFNLWDGEFRLGDYISGVFNPNVQNPVLCNKNAIRVFPSETYYIKTDNANAWVYFYDENMVYLSGGANNNKTFTIPSNARYINFNLSSQTGQACINISDSVRNGQYEPYWKKELHLGLNQIRVKSPNIWDEQWENGNLDDHGAEGSVLNLIRAKNYIGVEPSTAYYFKSPAYLWVCFYDANRNFISGENQVSNGIVTSPSNAAYVRFSAWDTYGTTYNHDIMINLSDPGFNGKYYPYGVLTFEGLNGVGDVKDEIADGKFVRRLGEVDLGELNTWTYSSTWLVFSATIYGGKVGIYGNAICAKYACVARSWSDLNNNTFSFGEEVQVLGQPSITIHDDNYNEATTFRAAMSGVLLRYELANPETFELVEPLDMSYEVDGDGTERRLPEDTASSVHAPFRADILYALNGSATLRNLDANYVRNDNIKQDTGNNENTVMSQAAVTRELGILSQRIAMTDLSFIDPQTGVGLFTRNTANTYVVRAAGNYMFPLVYGNAIKNGKPNPAAYTRIVSDYTAEFVNHLGNPITNPFIERNAGCNPFSATLLWQTGTGLIPSVSLVQGADCLYIRFSVASIPSDNGLACLAVKDVNGDVMWSWNIWLTTDDLTPETLTNHTGVEYEMMPEALGTIWSDRTNKLGYNPLFQWGRKDAVGLPAAYNDGTMHALYDIDGNSVTLSTYGVANDSDQGGTTRTVPYAIKHPELFFLYYNTTTYNWNNLAYFNNFWNAAMTSDSDLADNQATAIKTIYDPCPAGFMLPAGRAWTGFTTTGTNSVTASEFNVVGSFDAGWKFKKDAQDAVGVPYPASGCRIGGDGALYSVGSYGYCWSFAPNSATNARGLGFYSGYVYPLDYYVRAYGFSVRPVRELS